jgi:hypothetical protein
MTVRPPGTRQRTPGIPLREGTHGALSSRSLPPRAASVESIPPPPKHPIGRHGAKGTRETGMF